MPETPRDAFTPSFSTVIHVTDDKMLGLRITEILRQMQTGVGKPDPRERRSASSAMRRLSLGSEGAVGGLRTYLAEAVGKGYWDFIEVCSGVFVGITDALYRHRHRMVLPAERLVKIRIVCSGSLLIPGYDLPVTDGCSLIQVIGGSAPAEYLIEPGSPLRMVVVHALPEALPALGVKPEMLPAGAHLLLDPARTRDYCFAIDASARLIRVAREILESRDRLMSELRLTYIRGKAQELFCEALLRARPAMDRRAGGNRFRQSDLTRLHEARRILAGSLDCPPTIGQLSRLVGINRTKLKAGFREFFGETIREYRQRIRLAEARRLIEGTELPMAEIGLRVGFRHPSNFTQTIRRHFGVPPLELRRRYVSPSEEIE